MKNKNSKKVNTLLLPLLIAAIITAGLLLALVATQRQTNLNSKAYLPTQIRKVTQIIFSDDFENEPYPCTRFNAPRINNWITSPGLVDVLCGYPYSSQYIDIEGNSTSVHTLASTEFTYNLTPGDYQLSFKRARSNSGNGKDDVFHIYIKNVNNAVLLDKTYAMPATGVSPTTATEYLNISQSQDVKIYMEDTGTNAEDNTGTLVDDISLVKLEPTPTPTSTLSCGWCGTSCINTKIKMPCRDVTPPAGWQCTVGTDGKGNLACVVIIPSPTSKNIKIKR